MPAETMLDPRYSAPEAAAGDWSEAVARLSAAEVYWLTTVRPDGRPHVTPLIAVWSEGALHFCTGPDERKARNLSANPRVALTTGTNSLSEGFDLVVEGEAVQVTDEGRLRALAEAYVKKYGEVWRFEVRDGAFLGDGGTALVFSVAPRTAFGFAKGDRFGQTRWRF
ncbi:MULTISPECIES: pyridoxamine 5'-phosphate oxidase family protein [Streptomyces]|uniref:pyridoxamine 5'-phosphate oxidase family protein n=1 Tax=Streptomyces TaxID=1883 RepID=UPI0013191F5F|nr:MULTISPECIES: pyridoxamine 5'-phosphate oxidase family protein [Streptomyces]QGZ48655.1 pyridoxamine 5'-phosphate oxidase family protein [Streptomyces sp. QHH-9511]GGT63524.1 pyridoxamine 5'-phosphate oxidase [Streptomyces lateritius]